jgi:hypothetical protein
MSHVRRAVACIAALTATFVVGVGPARAADPADVTAAAAAVTWLKTQQQPDGGFERVFPGFETRDATLAIAEGSQTGSTWSTTEALAAVQATKVGGSGPSPLDFLGQDPAVISSPGAAAKTIVLTIEPLGLDPTSFGAFGSAPGAPQNLVTLMGGCSASSDAALNNLLYILLAEHLACGSMSPAGVADVRGQQQSDGSWKGDAFADLDMDTTALAVETLIADGADATDPAVHGALAFFAAHHQANGSWQAFGGDDVNSTSLVSIALRGAGFDPATPCWRDTVDPASAGTPYASPSAWLRSQQQPDGRIASQNDGFGINTFATSQSVQGLLQSWLPVARAPEQTCQLSPTPTLSTVTPAPGGSITVGGGGFMAHTQLTVELHSTPVVVGTTTTDAFGNYSVAVVIPADTPSGQHQLVVTGLGPDGQPRTVSTDITVLSSDTAPPVPAPVALTATPRFTG